MEEPEKPKPTEGPKPKPKPVEPEKPKPPPEPEPLPEPEVELPEQLPVPIQPAAFETTDIGELAGAFPLRAFQNEMHKMYADANYSQAVKGGRAKKAWKAWNEVDPTAAIKEALAPDKTAIYMGLKEGDLLDALKKGKIEHSDGIKPRFPGDREAWDKYLDDAFGINPEAAKLINDTDAAPKFGKLASKSGLDDLSILRDIPGGIGIRLRDSVRPNASVSIGSTVKDGSDYLRNAPAPLNAPDARLAQSVVDYRPADKTFFVKDYDATAEARKRLTDGKGTWKDVAGSSIDGVDEGLEVQIFGKIGIEEIEAVIVEDLEVARRLRKALDEAGLSHVKIEAAPVHSKLELLAEGRKSTFVHLETSDIELLGEDYLRKFLDESGLAEIVQPDHWEFPADFPFPESIRKWRSKYSDSDDLLAASTAEKRKFLADLQVEMRKSDALPEYFRVKYDPAEAFDLQHVTNPELLKKYPTGNISELPPPIPKSAGVEARAPTNVLKATEVEITPGPTGEVDQLILDLDLDAVHRREISHVVSDEVLGYDPDSFRFGVTKDNAWGINAESIRNKVDEAFGGQDPTDAIRKALSEDNTTIYMAMPEKDIESTTMSGQFWNALQSGHSAGGDEALERFIVEQRIFGVAENATDTPELLPNYMFLASKDTMDWGEMVNTMYGDLMWEFDPVIRKRSTVVLGDSLLRNPEDGFGRAPAAALNKVDKRIVESVVSFNKDTGLTIATRGSGQARKRLMEGSANYKDVVKSVGGEYAEVQVFGRLGLSHARALWVDSTAKVAYYRNLLDADGWHHVKIKAASYSNDLKRVEIGDSSSLGALGPQDIDNLGDVYIDAIVTHRGRNVFKRGGTYDTFDWAPSMQKWRDKYNTLDDFKKASAAEKRKFVKDYYVEVARSMEAGDDIRIRGAYKYDVKPERFGWTEHVLDKRLLHEFQDLDNLPTKVDPELQKLVDIEVIKARLPHLDADRNVNLIGVNRDFLEGLCKAVPRAYGCAAKDSGK